MFGTRGVKNERLLAWIMIAPVVIVILALVIGPLLVTLWQSLHRIDPMRSGTPFIGLRNYLALFADSDVNAAWRNTFIYVVLAVVLETLFGVAAALLVNNVKSGRKWLLAALVLPWALPPVVNAIVWLWIYNPSAGLLNALLLSAGVIEEKRVWFNDTASALILVTIVHIWRMMPQTAIIVLAVLQSIPRDLYEAAKIDGATTFRMFWAITLPLIASGLAIAMTQSTVYAFNMFDEAWILAGRGLDTRTILIQVYVSAFQDLRFSYGMALSILVMLASVAISLIYVFRVQRDTGLDG